MNAYLRSYTGVFEHGYHHAHLLLQNTLRLSNVCIYKCTRCAYVCTVLNATATWCILMVDVLI